jgi:hypothetical protein
MRNTVQLGKHTKMCQMISIYSCRTIKANPKFPVRTKQSLQTTRTEPQRSDRTPNPNPPFIACRGRRHRRARGVRRPHPSLSPAPSPRPRPLPPPISTAAQRSLTHTQRHPYAAAWFISAAALFLQRWLRRRWTAAAAANAAQHAAPPHNAAAAARAWLPPLTHTYT